MEITGFKFKEITLYKPGPVISEETATIHLGLGSLQDSSDLPVLSVGHA